MSSSRTQINFGNEIHENENYNILTYEYLYNGERRVELAAENVRFFDVYFATIARKFKATYLLTLSGDGCGTRKLCVLNMNE